MDPLLLEAAVRELTHEAIRQPVHRLIPQGPERQILLLGDGWDPEAGGTTRVRVHLGIEPLRGRLHRTRLRAAPASPPTPFQGLLSRELEGAILTGLRKPRWERFVVLEFSRDGLADRRLVVELFGPRGQLWWLDGRDRVLGFARAIHGRRAFAVGDTWEPPPGDRLDLEAIDEEGFRRIAGDPEGMSARLVRGLQGMSPAVAAGLERSADIGVDPWPRFREMVEAVVRGRFAHWHHESTGTAGEGFVCAVPVPSPAGSIGEEHGSAGEALDAWGLLRDRESRLASRRASLEEPLRRELRRLDRLQHKLEVDLAREDESAELVRRGNILLAGLAAARVQGDQATLPDPFDPEGGPVTLTIDPRWTLQENADRFFHRARKIRRGRGTVESRLAEVRERLPRLREFSLRLEDTPSLESLAVLEEELAGAGLGIVRRVRSRKAEAARTKAPEVLPIRVYRSADGMEILVGRSSRDNDALTFQVATAQDFWLHAQGRAGAHVVVRNPDRLSRLPPRTLEQAARLAAFHSKAREAGKVEVMFTQRRHVKKGRNLPAGAVRVGKHESIRVAPTMPFEEV